MSKMEKWDYLKFKLIWLKFWARYSLDDSKLNFDCFLKIFIFSDLIVIFHETLVIYWCKDNNRNTYGTATQNVRICGTDFWIVFFLNLSEMVDKVVKMSKMLDIICNIFKKNENSKICSVPNFSSLASFLKRGW